MSAHSFVIAAPRSGEGKTTIACGLMAALIQRGLVVQPFKVGPDYIDPSFHTVICHRNSVNLDSWMTSGNLVRHAYAVNAATAQVSVVEGVMGLFDGSDGTSGSTAEIAQLLGLSVILVVDVARMAASAGALVAGFANYMTGINVVGVIVNKVGSERHYNMVKTAIEESTGIPVLGGLRRDALLTLPETVKELSLTWCKETAKVMESSLDLELLLKLTQVSELDNTPQLVDNLSLRPVQGNPILAVAKDKAFTAYYQENLDLITAYGGKIVEFSPLEDSYLPAGTCGIYLSGRSNAEFLKRLSANATMRSTLFAAYKQGVPILAEGGGFDYLTEGYEQEDGLYPLVGIIPGKITLQKRLVAMGYRAATLNEDTILGAKGLKLRGHEYHRSQFTGSDQNGPLTVFSASNRPQGIAGFSSDNVLASQIHWHFLSNHLVVGNFLNKLREFKDRTI